MQLRHATLTLLATGSFATGCLKPVTSTATIEPFAIDGDPSPLNQSCSTDGLAGCETTQGLKNSVATMQALHDTQMTEMGNALRSLSGVLGRQDSTPIARVTALELSTDDWTDPEGSYPALLEVRIQNSRGLDRMGSNSVNDMNGALAALDTLSDTHAEQWKATLEAQPSGLVLPQSITDERAMSKVAGLLDNATYNFEVPSHLAVSHIKRDVAPWVMVASHVITEPGMQHAVVQEHQVQLTPAVAISAAPGAYAITEQKPSREIHKMTSMITPADACQSLRGELRYTRADAPVPLRADFRQSASNGGAK